MVTITNSIEPHRLLRQFGLLFLHQTDQHLTQVTAAQHLQIRLDLEEPVTQIGYLALNTVQPGRFRSGVKPQMIHIVLQCFDLYLR